MKRQAVLIIILLSSGAFPQDKPKLIGEIEFFGYSGIDLSELRAALPFHEGDRFFAETFPDQAEKTGDAVKQSTGHPPTDIASVCCDDQGNWIVFIGLSGKTLRYNDPPKGTARLPENILNLYERWSRVMMESVQQGASAEDRSQGYALSESTPVRAIQLEMRVYAVGHEVLLRKVLATAKDDQQRFVAAQLLGYARQSRLQIAALVRAHLDSNGTVRNNATRALIVLAESSPKVAVKIPVADFVKQLLSGTWTDLNKASFLLDSITRGGKAQIPVALNREDVRARLIEMARWRTGHAEAARHMLARMGETHPGAARPRWQR